MISPDIAFTVRDERIADGNPDSSSVGVSDGFTGLITTESFVDETFIEFAVGSESVTSATLSQYRLNVWPRRTARGMPIP